VTVLAPRDLALAALRESGRYPGFAERFLEQQFRRASPLGERDRAFTLHLVQGVLRWRLKLDWIVKQSARFPFERIDPPVLDILRLALYQIFFMDRVPDSAAVNEAVKQARKIAPPHITRFVNGLLRNVCRGKDQLAFPDRGEDLVRHLSVRYSYPPWIVDKWIRELGPDGAERLLDAGNRIPLLVVRTNALKVDREGLLERLRREGLEVRPTLFSPEGIVLEKLRGPIHELKSFKDGLFQVQGEAAQVCSHLLGAEPGEWVLDLCAGLGGKTTHLGELMGGRGKIIALDRVRRRLLMLAESAMRLGVDCIRPVVADAGKDLLYLFKRRFDKILVDGPCSGLGVVSKHPDGKWEREEKDVRRLAGVQEKMLNEAAPLLREGGRMLYTVCTISREESEGVVEDFLAAHGEMRLENLGDRVPDWGKPLVDGEGFLRTLPHVHQMDGFFGALFVKKGRSAPTVLRGQTKGDDLWGK
jgi:16S rRNA (cytosine967-C5)-methyltransferase